MLQATGDCLAHHGMCKQDLSEIVNEGYEQSSNVIVMLEMQLCLGQKPSVALARSQQQLPELKVQNLIIQAHFRDSSEVVRLLSSQRSRQRSCQLNYLCMQWPSSSAFCSDSYPLRGDVSEVWRVRFRGLSTASGLALVFASGSAGR